VDSVNLRVSFDEIGAKGCSTGEFSVNEELATAASPDREAVLSFEARLEEDNVDDVIEERMVVALSGAWAIVDGEDRVR
jgi:uncharacterized protein YchJ